MLRRLLLVWVCLVLQGAALSFAKESSSSSDGALKARMHQFYGEVLALQPFLGSQAAFLNRKNEKAILAKLKQLESIVSQAKAEKTLQSRNYRFNLDAFEKHVRDTRMMFERGDKDYARWMTSSNLHFCSQCHTQLPQKVDRKVAVPRKGDDPKQELERAEFLFLVRRYRDALQVYNRVLKGYPKNGLSKQDLNWVAKRKLTIWTRIWRRPQEAVRSFEATLKNDKLPPSLVEDLEAWTALFRLRSRKKMPNPKKMSTRQLLDYANQNLEKTLWDGMIEADNPRLGTYLFLSGMLYEHLLSRTQDTVDTPELLYLTARLERRLRNQFFGSTADFYLRECMSRFPKSPFAARCLAEYEASRKEAYPKGFPPPVRREVEDLRKRVRPHSRH